MILLSIENLSNETNEQEVKKIFSCYGKIRSIKLSLGAPHSRHAGSGFIEMEGSDAQKVISALNGRLLWGKILRITEVNSTEKTQTNFSYNSMAQNQPAVETTDNYIHQPFRVASVEKVTSPELGPDKDWYRYTLICGNSCITGLHRGTIAEVTEYAVNSAHEFNLRNSPKRGRSYTWPSSSKKK